MNIILTLEEYNDNSVYFFEKIKNNIIPNGFFIKIIYSSCFFSLNTILLDVSFTYLRMEQNKCHDVENNKIKYFIDIDINQKTIERLKYIEQNILKKINIQGKTPVYKLYETLKNGYIKIFDKCLYFDDTDSLRTILKISGVWISDKNFGLSYKFNHP